nr:hypothetical protein [Tanacetum cinerariifolium]
SPEDSEEEQMEVDTTDAEVVADVEASAANTREIVVDPLVIGDSSESSRGGIPDLEDTIYDIVHYMSERFRDSYSPEDSEEEQMEVDTTDAEVVADVGGIPDLEDTIYDIVHYMSEVRIDRITKIETTQRQLEASQLVSSGERANLVERIGSLRLKYLKVRAMLSI